MNGAAFGRAVEAAVDGLIKLIERLPPRLLGVGLGLGLAWLVQVIHDTDIAGDYQSPFELEAAMYYGPQELPATPEVAASGIARVASTTSPQATTTTTHN